MSSMAETNSPNLLVILLHGVGSSGDNLAPLGEEWAGTLGDAVFVSPDAPEPSSFGAGYQWFSVAGVTPENRGERIAAARPGFDALINGIIADNGFSDRLDRVALVGFSQGTIMSLDAVADGRFGVGAVVGFSGRLSSPEPLSPSKGMPVFLVHGTADDVIPSWESEQAADTLAKHGFDVETSIEPGLGHTISGAGAGRAVEFLAKVFGYEAL
ncbi:prolyl oligopeptidase family serine peptidase [Rhizobium sp. CFBP 8752]|nr:prolyl oligopeptidase family serine peptidase [Rhizobium sp. CFBP 8752]MBD8663841.1 prolyl oligopeptidase family serine peptidase [Rhizobium sp. CFBP 8752]